MKNVHIMPSREESVGNTGKSRSNPAYGQRQNARTKNAQTKSSREESAGDTGQKMSIVALSEGASIMPKGMVSAPGMGQRGIIVKFASMMDARALHRWVESAIRMGQTGDAKPAVVGGAVMFHKKMVFVGGTGLNDEDMHKVEKKCTDHARRIMRFTVLIDEVEV
mmetsp:Transcript_22181/g.39048  ORF Transcript_22181/g.39048 Transcript_22181/m.39048 type:complete len:165 (+) Transcript_22181:1024-1518(+)